MSFTVEEEKPLVEDFLSVDQPVPGQNFCCMSFVSPEKVIRRKQMYLVKEFLKDLLSLRSTGRSDCVPRSRQQLDARAEPCWRRFQSEITESPA